MQMILKCNKCGIKFTTNEYNPEEGCLCEGCWKKVMQVQSDW